MFSIPPNLIEVKCACFGETLQFHYDAQEKIRTSIYIRGVSSKFCSLSGYNLVTTIPTGATNITIEELSRSRSYLGKIHMKTHTFDAFMSSLHTNTLEYAQRDHKKPIDSKTLFLQTLENEQFGKR